MTIFVMRSLFVSLLLTLVAYSSGFLLHQHPGQRNIRINAPSLILNKCTTVNSESVLITKATTMNSVTISNRNRFHYSVSKTIGFITSLAKKRILSIVGALCVIILPFAKTASAAQSVIKGVDLYGRMPYDEWLFSNSRLVDPKILKRSFVETIVQELPDVIGNFKRRKQFSELSVILSGLGYFFLGAVVISVLYKGALSAGLSRGNRKDPSGREFSASAISKKGPRKGKQIENMGEGWLDMEFGADDEDPDPKKKPKKDDDDDDE